MCSFCGSVVGQSLKKRKEKKTLMLSTDLKEGCPYLTHYAGLNLVSKRTYFFYINILKCNLQFCCTLGDIGKQSFSGGILDNYIAQKFVRTSSMGHVQIFGSRR